MHAKLAFSWYQNCEPTKLLRNAVSQRGMVFLDCTCNLVTYCCLIEISKNTNGLQALSLDKREPRESKVPPVFQFCSP